MKKRYEPKYMWFYKRMLRMLTCSFHDNDEILEKMETKKKCLHLISDRVEISRSHTEEVRPGNCVYQITDWRQEEQMITTDNIPSKREYLNGWAKFRGDRKKTTIIKNNRIQKLGESRNPQRSLGAPYILDLFHKLFIVLFYRINSTHSK